MKAMSAINYRVVNALTCDLHSGFCTNALQISPDPGSACDLHSGFCTNALHISPDPGSACDLHSGFCTNALQISFFHITHCLVHHSGSSPGYTDNCAYTVIDELILSIIS
jgi:hypothetical protein